MRATRLCQLEYAVSSGIVFGNIGTSKKYRVTYGQLMPAQVDKSQRLSSDYSTPGKSAFERDVAE